MKLLLDENLPEELRHYLPGHEVFTVGFLGWKGTRNGELLRRAHAEGFDVLVTGDTGIEHEHNSKGLPLAIVILHAKSNSLKRMLPLAPALLRTLETMEPRTLAHVGPSAHDA